MFKTRCEYFNGLAQTEVVYRAGKRTGRNNGLTQSRVFARITADALDAFGRAGDDTR